MIKSNVTINSKNKDLLFRFIFGAEENKHHLLSLYNAINNTNYTNTDDIEINTLSDVIYIRVKNDVSFILYSDMSLYEHQSTFNPNMPLRGMIYFSNLYSQFLSEHCKNIYGKTLVKIPTPRYTVFYNGYDSYPDKLELKLSDAFETPDTSGQFEWTATMLNINQGHNQEIMDKCQALFQYSDFNAKIKEYKQSMSFEEAVDKAVDYAIANNYLDGFFKKHREGIMHSCLTEFNEEAFRKGIHEEGYNDGFNDGFNNGFSGGFNEAIIKSIKLMQKNSISKDSIIADLMDAFELSNADATVLVNEHWN